MSGEILGTMDSVSADSSKIHGSGVPNVRSEIIGVSDGRWRSFLQGTPHDFYHRPEYIAFCAEYEGGEPLAFIAEDRDTSAAFFIPLLRRPLPPSLEAPGDWHDFLTPYGYPGPLMRGGDAVSLERFLAAFQDHALQSGTVSAFFRLHPLLHLPLDPLRKFGQLVAHGQTVFINLSQTEEEIQRGIRENHRRDVRKLKNRGFTVQIDAWEHFEDFIVVYQETMKRLQAGDFYFFSSEYFFLLREALGETLHLITVFSPDGRLAAGGIFTSHGGIVGYHLGGTAEEFLRLAPSKLLFDAAWRWGQSDGQEVLHLGGGVGGQTDSLFNFKKGFSSGCADFFTCRAVIDVEKYRELIVKMDKLSNRKSSMKTDFFPLYRRI